MNKGDLEGRNEDGMGYGGDGEGKGSKGCRWNEEGWMDGWDGMTRSMSIRCWRVDERQRHTRYYLNCMNKSELAYMTVDRLVVHARGLALQSAALDLL